MQANSFSESLQSPRPVLSAHRRTPSNLSAHPSESPDNQAQASVGYQRPYSPYNGGLEGSPPSGHSGLQYPAHEPMRRLPSVPIDPRLQSLQAQDTPEYSTPFATGLAGSPGFSTRAGANCPSHDMLPPFRSYPSQGSMDGNQEDGTEEHGSKRIRLSTGNDFAPRTLISSPEFTQVHDDVSTGSSSHTLPSPNGTASVGAPTPASATSVESASFQMPKPTRLQPPSNLRRLSVNSLLSGPHVDAVDSPFDDFKRPIHRSQRTYSDYSTCYGYDLGKPDLDLPNNDDANAIRVMSPATARGIPSFDAGNFEQVETDEP
ncbi:hypothetical protein LTS18_007685, partial [Coniosporium uncinatum]